MKKLMDDFELGFEKIDNDPPSEIWRVAWKIRYQDRDTIIRTWYSDREKAVADMAAAEERGYTIILFAKYTMADQV